MLRLLLLLLLAVPAGAETRCGWYHHPTPGWHYLRDADGEWWFSTSAKAPAFGYVSVPGFEDAYDQAFDDRVRLDYTGTVTDYSYGFSCACAEGEFRGSKVLSLARLREIPMARCDEDSNLPKFELYGDDG